jgi:hypothetical protein
VSEQYPEALGNTVTELSSLLPSGDTNLVVSKKQFSMIPGTAIVPNPVLEFVDNYSTRKQVRYCSRYFIIYLLKLIIFMIVILR